VVDIKKIVKDTAQEFIPLATTQLSGWGARQLGSYYLSSPKNIDVAEISNIANTLSPVTVFRTDKDSRSYYTNPPQGPFIHINDKTGDSTILLHEIGHAKIDEALGRGKGGVAGAINAAFNATSGHLYDHTKNYVATTLAGLNPVISGVDQLTGSNILNTSYERKGLSGKILDTVLSNRAKIVAAGLLPRVAEEAAASIIGAHLGKKKLNIPYSRSAGILPAFGSYVALAAGNIGGNYLADRQYLQNKAKYLEQQQEKSAEVPTADELKKLQKKDETKEIASAIASYISNRAAEVADKVINGNAPALTPEQIARASATAGVPFFQHTSNGYGFAPVPGHSAPIPIIVHEPNARESVLYHELGHHRVTQALGIDSDIHPLSHVRNSSRALAENIALAPGVSALARKVVESSPSLTQTAYERRGLTGKILDTYLANQAKIYAAAVLPMLAEEAAASIIGAREAKQVAGIGYGTAAKELLPSFLTYAAPLALNTVSRAYSDKIYRRNRDAYLASRNKTANFLAMYGDDIVDAGIDAYNLLKAQGYVGKRKPATPKAVTSPVFHSRSVGLQEEQ
jgi:hypothetical protein